MEKQKKMCIRDSPYWEEVPRIEYIVTASELLTHRAVKKGIEANRILPFGIPIHPKFNQPIAQQDAREQLGLEPDRPTILMMGGSMGYSDNKKLILQLGLCGIPFQLLVVCGNNKKQYAEMVSMADKMCIRDSPSLDCVHAHLLGHAVLSQLGLDDAAGQAGGVDRCIDFAQYIPVSYTHLDVYKRQVVGIGVNLKFDRDAYPELADIAGGIWDETHHLPTRAQLAASILNAFEPWYDKLLAGESKELLQAYRSRMNCLRKRIMVSSPQGQYPATCADLTDEGNLVIVDQNGTCLLYTSRCV